MVKFRLLIFFLIILSNYSYSQLGVHLQVNGIVPTGNYSLVFRDGLGVEVGFGKNNERLSSAFIFGYYELRTHLDSFSSYVNYNNQTILPGFEIFNNYQVFTIGAGVSYKLLNYNKISSIIGADINALLISYDYQRVITTYIESEGNKSRAGLAVQPKVGLNYNHNNQFVLEAGIGYSMAFETNYNIQSYYKPYFKVGYDF